MNVLITNKYHTMLQNLDIEVVKSLNGDYNVEEIISQFKNFYFQKMIIDITAIKNGSDLRNLQKLSLEFDMGKVVILLEPFQNQDKSFLSKLVSIGIYNFTSTLDGVRYLVQHSNSYKDVAYLHEISTSASQPVKNEAVLESAPSGIRQTRVIGFKNITDAAGATTLVYMILKTLETTHNVLAFECDKRDSVFFNENKFKVSSTAAIINDVNKNRNKDIILIDLNSSLSGDKICDDIVFLIEPSIIKLNRLMAIDNRSISRLKGKKIILNKSLLSSKDVSEFSFESGANIFFNVPPINDREIDKEVLIELLRKMNIQV